MYSREVTILPYFQETVISTQSSEYIISKIDAVTSSKLLLQNQNDPAHFFTGWVREGRFRISLKINRPNNYLPLVIGNIEPTSNGCIVFLSYTLFPTTKIFLIFWNLFVLIVCITASYQYKTFLYGALGVLLIVFIQWIAWSNFNLQLKRTRELLINILIH
ncbi:MAG: hypothetical protein KDC99_00765 [Cyclobacteriaceae bacterium]|nr:hypothetical protein [Cyclobacteriaceae bacterium]